jgi:hypothetical protein
VLRKTNLTTHSFIQFFAHSFNVVATSFIANNRTAKHTCSKPSNDYAFAKQEWLGCVPKLLGGFQNMGKILQHIKDLPRNPNSEGQNQNKTPTSN